MLVIAEIREISPLSLAIYRSDGQNLGVLGGIVVDRLVIEVRPFISHGSNDNAALGDRIVQSGFHGLWLRIALIHKAA